MTKHNAAARHGLAAGTKRWLLRCLAALPLLALPAFLPNAPFGVQEAAAQGSSILRSQSRVTSSAISRQVQRAFRPRLRVRNDAGDVNRFSLGGNSRFLALSSEDNRVRVWDLQNGRQIRDVSSAVTGGVTSLDVGARQPQGGRTRQSQPQEGQRLLIIGGQRGAALWDALSGSMIANLQGHRGAVSAVRLSADGSTAATGGSDRTVRLWDTATGRERRQLTGHGDPITALAFSPDGRYLVSGDADELAILWDVASGRELGRYTDHDGDVTAAVFADNTTFLTGDDDGEVHVWQVGNPRKLRSWSIPGDPVMSLYVDGQGNAVAAGGDDEVEVRQIATGRQVAEISDRRVDITSAGFAPARDRLITAGDDGRAKIWDTRSGNLVAQLILTRDGWAVVDNVGRFDGSQGGVGNVDWEASQATLNIVNFSQPYYEPGLLAKLFQAPQAIITQASPPVEQGVGVPPTVEIDASPGSASQPGPGQITVRAENEGGGVQEVRLYQNGKLVDPARVASDNASGDTRTVVYNVNLAAGANRFRAVATSIEDIEGAADEVTVSVRAAQPRPTLHVVAVGINRYANSQLNLNYAVADARGFVQWARSQGRRAYGNVEFYELYDRQATASNIVDLMRQLERTSPQDVVVMYMAGHGEVSGDSWYFLPTEFGRTLSLQAVASQGVSSAAIQQGIVKMGAQRVVLLIDACKSGSLRRAFGGDAGRKRLQSVSQEAGIHVMAATDKDQLAVELDKLGHGAFTYTVLQALRGQADTSPRDGDVNVKEVLTYSVDTVPVIAFRETQFEQFPTVYSQGADFRMATR